MQPATTATRFTGAVPIIRVGAAVLIAVWLLTATGCNDRAARQAAIDKANAQVRRIADDLDKRTTETGVYLRVKKDEIKETDPWGTAIQVSYSQGGVAEVVTVRSAGPDREFHTDDDLVAQGMSANLKGIGQGIKKNVEDTAARAAKGVVRGTVDGVKESLKGTLKFPRRKKVDKAKAEVAPDKRDAQPRVD